MTALSIPVALAIALRCAPAEDPGMLVAIARQESGLEPLTLHDDTSGKVLHGAGVIECGEAPDRRRPFGRPRRLADQQPQPGAAGSGRRRCVRAVQSRGGRRPAPRIVQPIQYRQPVAGDRERLCRRGDGRDPRGEDRQPGHAPADDRRGPTANLRTRPVRHAVADRAEISYSQPRGSSRCPG